MVGCSIEQDAAYWEWQIERTSGGSTNDGDDDDDDDDNDEIGSRFVFHLGWPIVAMKNDICGRPRFFWARRLC